jgi:hypothetical protein
LYGLPRPTFFSWEEPSCEIMAILEAGFNDATYEPVRSARLQANGRQPGDPARAAAVFPSSCASVRACVSCSPEDGQRCWYPLPSHRSHVITRKRSARRAIGRFIIQSDRKSQKATRFRGPQFMHRMLALAVLVAVTPVAGRAADHARLGKGIADGSS